MSIDKAFSAKYESPTADMPTAIKKNVIENQGDDWTQWKNLRGLGVDKNGNFLTQPRQDNEKASKESEVDYLIELIRISLDYYSTTPKLEDVLEKRHGVLSNNEIQKKIEYKGLFFDIYKYII
jgi:hypothetical protein